MDLTQTISQVQNSKTTLLVKDQAIGPRFGTRQANHSEIDESKDPRYSTPKLATYKRIRSFVLILKQGWEKRVWRVVT